VTSHLPDWLAITKKGLWCAAGGFFVDPLSPVDRAVVTHGHADHARPGHGAVLTTPATAAIMRVRYGKTAAGLLETLDYDEEIRLGDVLIRFAPAGHILGSAQVVLQYRGTRVVISGDFKRRYDPTCTPFEVVGCDLFITEATFGLPVFNHPPDETAVDKLLISLRLFPDRAHLIGVYALGKCQRLIRLLCRAGYDRPIWIHGALSALCDLYQRHGIDLGPLRSISGTDRKELVGEIILCPPSALADRWARGFVDPVNAVASGWMMVRQRARQRGVELPLVLSDHADWGELTQTLHDVGAPRVLITHGREDVLVHYAHGHGFEAGALSLEGYDEEGA
jgi:putative mRNA 3-end processing factor